MFDLCKSKEECEELYKNISKHLHHDPSLMTVLLENYNIAIGYFESSDSEKKKVNLPTGGFE